MILFLACEEERPFLNEKPEILSIHATNILAQVGCTDTLICVAVDPDGDSISYNWDVPSGYIEDFGDTIIWHPLEFTAEPVFCTVTDPHGASVTGGIDIQLVDTISVNFSRLTPYIRMPMETTMVIQSDSALWSIWDAYHVGYRDGAPIPPPEVDFNVSMVIVVTYGYGAADGCIDDLKFIESIYAVCDTLYIQQTYEGWFDQGDCLMSIEPRHWAVIRRTDLPIVFLPPVW